MEEIKLLIQSHIDRERIVLALANSGYNVRVKEEQEYIYKDKLFYVIFTPKTN